MIRREWVDGSTTPVDHYSSENATLADFAYDATEALLQAEPRLGTIAALVQQAGPLGEATWREVDALVAVLLGPTCVAPRLVPVTSQTMRLRPLMSGEVTKRRFMSALRHLSEQVA